MREEYKRIYFHSPFSVVSDPRPPDKDKPFFIMYAVDPYKAWGIPGLAMIFAHAYKDMWECRAWIDWINKASWAKYMAHGKIKF